MLESNVLYRFFRTENRNLGRNYELQLRMNLHSKNKYVKSQCREFFRSRRLRASVNSESRFLLTGQKLPLPLLKNTSNIADRPLKIARLIWTFPVGSRKGSEGGAGGKGHGADVVRGRDRTHPKQEDGGYGAERRGES